MASLHMRRAASGRSAAGAPGAAASLFQAGHHRPQHPPRTTDSAPCHVLSLLPPPPLLHRAHPALGHHRQLARTQAAPNSTSSTTSSSNSTASNATSPQQQHSDSSAQALLERQLSSSQASTSSTSAPSPLQQQQQLQQQHQEKQQAEQERELSALNSLAAKEQSYEGLAAWVGLAVAFGAGIWYVQGAGKAQEYFAGYLLEQSLSVDNLFVFILVFNYFKTPPAAQSKVLTWGIATAAVLRAVFIVAGVELIELFQPLLIVFAAILIWSSYKILAASEEEDDEEDLSDNSVVKLCRRFIPTTEHYDGDKFWSTRQKEGAAPGVVERVATPLLLTLAVVELSDVLFAVDSIPAVFGVTLDPFIIYTSNIFAILSLRALYGFVSNIMSELRYLDKSVALVLGFIGAKMLLGFADVNIPTDASLLVVGLVLGGGVAASLLLPEPDASE